MFYGDRLPPGAAALCSLLLFLAVLGGFLWLLVDLSTALMALPNLTALLLLSPQALGYLRAWARTQK